MLCYCTSEMKEIMKFKYKDREILDDTGIEEIYYDEYLSFQRAVLGKSRNQCMNCGSSDRIRVRMVVPAEAGGVLVESNGIVLCRTCDMARDSVAKASDKNSSYVVSIWMSRSLREKMASLLGPSSFRSWSSLTRYLISKYILDERYFDDLEQYQDFESEVKVTVRVNQDVYSTFTAMLKRRGLTVTEAVKGLYLMYASDAGAVIKRRNK